MSHHAQPFLIDASAYEKNGDHQPTEGEQGVYRERPLNSIYERSGRDDDRGVQAETDRSAGDLFQSGAVVQPYPA
jgi:hypothetical protein